MTLINGGICLIQISFTLKNSLNVFLLSQGLVIMVFPEVVLTMSFLGRRYLFLLLFI